MSGLVFYILLKSLAKIVLALDEKGDGYTRSKVHYAFYTLLASSHDEDNDNV